MQIAFRQKFKSAHSSETVTKPSLYRKHSSKVPPKNDQIKIFKVICDINVFTKNLSSYHSCTKFNHVYLQNKSEQ